MRCETPWLYLFFIVCQNLFIQIRSKSDSTGDLKLFTEMLRLTNPGTTLFGLAKHHGNIIGG